MAVIYDIIEDLAKEIEKIQIVNEYQSDVKAVFAKAVDIWNLDGNEYPAVVIIVDGPGIIEVEDSTQFRMAQEVAILIGVRSDELAQEKVLTLAKDVEKAIHAAELGSNCLSITIDHWTYSIREDKGAGEIRILIRYLDDEIKTADPPGSDVYGSTDILQDVLTKLEAELNSLKTAMASLDPTFGYVYQGHLQAGLNLSAVTIGIEDATADPQYVSDANLAMVHRIIASIRVHTAYRGGVRDGLRNIRLINSVMSYLQTTLDLGDDYDIEQINEIGTNLEFEESATYGGEVRITIQTIKEYAQT